MTYLPIANYLPHQDPMVLLDRVVEVNGMRIICEVTIRPDSPFCDGARVNGWVGVEYMAQSVGVLSGWHDLHNGGQVRVGFLVGTRHYQSQVTHFSVGEVLQIECSQEIRNDGGLNAMSCIIRHANEQPISQATLLVYQPENLQSYLEQA